jgi:hypothetical protein
MNFGFVDCPPRYSPTYESENEATLTVWQIEREMAQLKREANGLECQAWVLDQSDQADIAEVALDMMEARWAQWATLRDRLDEIEGGF